MAEPKPLSNPEGLPFPPEGLGWTKTDTEIPRSFSKVTLLTDHNVAAVRSNHPTEWEQAMDAIGDVSPPPTRNQRTGAFTSGLSTQERERLVALSLLIEHGAIAPYRPPLIEEAHGSDS